MADLVIAEYKEPSLQVYGGTAPIYSDLVTSQFLSVGTASAVMNSATKMVRLQNISAAGFYFKLGGSDVSAAVDTAGNDYLAAGATIDLEVSGGATYIDTAA